MKRCGYFYREKAINIDITMFLEGGKSKGDVWKTVDNCRIKDITNRLQKRGLDQYLVIN